MTLYLIMAASFFIFGSWSAWTKGRLSSEVMPILVLSVFWPIIIICAMTAGFESIFRGEE
jgi:hypothetical protein